MAAFPDSITFGRVIGRYILALADGPGDSDHNPDPIPAVGSVKLTPTATPIYATGTSPATVVQSPIVCALNGNGEITDPTGYTGVWLVTGNYKVSFTLTGVTIPEFTITVTTAHTDSAPLDLTLAAPLRPGPTDVFVVNRQVYLDTLAARDAALAAAASAGGIPTWSATTVYTTSSKVFSPTGDIVRANTAHTSGSSYDSTKWTVLIPSAASLATTYSTLAQLAANPDQLAVGTITRSSTGAATGFGVLWPDGATGIFSGTESTTTPGAIDAYTVTHVKGGTTITYTQPALTRNASGAVTNRPAITVA